MKYPFLFLILCGFLKAQILADFETNILIPGTQDFKTFTVELDHQQAPMATANFMLLSGLEDEEWLGPVGDTFPAPHIPLSPVTPGRVFQKVDRVALNIVYQEADPNTLGDVDKYIVRQATTIFAILSATPFGNSYPSLTGENPVSLEYDNENRRFKIIISDNRDWLDSRFPAIRNAPLYHCLLYTSPSPRDQRGSRMPSSA